MRRRSVRRQNFDAFFSNRSTVLASRSIRRNSRTILWSRVYTSENPRGLPSGSRVRSRARFPNRSRGRGAVNHPVAHSPTSAEHQSCEKSTVLKLQLFLLCRYRRRGAQGARLALSHVAYGPANGDTRLSGGLHSGIER